MLHRSPGRVGFELLQLNDMIVDHAPLVANPTDDTSRHLTEPRRAVLQILADEGPTGEAGIRAVWQERRPDMSPRHVGALPRMIRNLLWRLEILGWVAEGEHGWELTGPGRSVVESPIRSSGLH